MSTKHIAIIPARSGSKGLKNKNIKELNGKPMLCYSIDAARDSGLYDEIFVSTDSNEYAAIAREYGASVPFLRDPALAKDNSSSWDVVKSDLNHYKELKKEFTYVTLLQPTSPLRTGEDLVNSFKLLNEKHAECIVSICETDHSPLFCNTIPSTLSMSNFLDTRNTGPRQAFDTYYRINGAVYMMSVKHLFNEDNLYGSNCFAYIMPKERSVDIDDEIDFIMAEALLKHRR